MASSNGTSPPLRIFFFDVPRANSQVFYKMFSSHPQVAWFTGFHPFAGAALYGPGRLQLRTRHCEAAEKAQLEWGSEYPETNTNTWATSVKDLRDKITEAEGEGKIFFGKEHVSLCTKQDLMLSAIRGEDKSLSTANPTYIPDEILESLTPIFLFRHPALLIPSSYNKVSVVAGQEPEDEDFVIHTTLQWTRNLYDYFVAKGRKPAVIEAQDFVYNTKPTMNKLCRHLGIDESGWSETWDPLPKEYWPDHKPAELTLDLNTETEKWRKQWGEKVAHGLRKLVEAELPTHEYLRSVKLTA